MTGEGRHHQAEREKRGGGRGGEGGRKKKTSASRSAVALSNYKAKRDMSWQVGEGEALYDNNGKRRQPSATVHTTLWVGLAQTERLC